VRRFYAQLGSEEFYRRRLNWLQANGEATSYARLSGYLRRIKLDIFPHR
jgi:hypothetical protein